MLFQKMNERPRPKVKCRKQTSADHQRASNSLQYGSRKTASAELQKNFFEKRLEPLIVAALLTKIGQKLSTQ